MRNMNSICNTCQARVGGRLLLVGGLVLVLAACSDFGDRDNPLDPGAGNYVAQIDLPTSSEDKVLSSSSEGKEKESSSSVEEKSSDSSAGENRSSSSVAEESSNSGIVSSASENSSSSGETPVSSSNEAPVVSSSSDTPVSSSSVEQLPVSSSSVEPPVVSSSSAEQTPVSSSAVEPPPVSSSSSAEQAPASSSAVEPPIVSSSSAEQAPVSSSSVEQPPVSSSSVADWTCGISTIKRGDREYKTVVIKEQCWMQENLRYVPSTGNTMCYDSEESNCDKYGLLYDYEAASVACPTGWRLPTSAEYEALAEYSMEGAPLYEAGAHFKAVSGWTPESGDDFLEFTALPGGKCDDEQICSNIGKLGYWWTSTEKVKNTSHLALALNGDGDSYSAENKMDNDQYISVRCVKK